MSARRSLSVLLLLGLTACKREPSTTTQSPSAKPDHAGPTDKGARPRAFAELDRPTFNRMAARLNLPLYWRADTNGNGVADPEEISTLLFYPEGTNRTDWVEAGKPTKALETAYDHMVRASRSAGTGVDTPETARQKLVVEELDGASATLVTTDLRTAKEEDRALMRHLLAAGKAMDTLFSKQKGIARLPVPEDDASRSLFRRNWGPACVTPGKEKNQACTALPGAKVTVGVYPDTVQTGDSFCEALEKLPDAKKLLAPFVAVTGTPPKLVASSYSEVFGPEMAAVSKELSAAAESLTDPAEGALRLYLTAAAKSFLTNDWQPSDEAWSKMTAQSSAWYVRAAPDEVYWEPCSHKAGFHLDVARINKASLVWQEKLTPVQQDMEEAMAAVAGAPYRSRKVSFHLPDFIDVVFNAGESRSSIGATVGQSLPNWGPVAAEGRGRTVAMSNLYTDPDSLAVRRKRAESLFTKRALEPYVDDAAPGLLSTILHEASHNLGPSHEYKAAGKTDEQSFGGDLASMMEELKAQSGALFYVEMLRGRKLMSDALARQTYVDSLVWATQHIARGMTTGDGHRKPYSQLAAIQIGFLLDEGALTWDPAAVAANGTDHGAIDVVYDKLPAAVDRLMKLVAGLKAKGDRPGAEALATKYVDGARVPQAIIAERVLRFPQPNFVFAVEL